MRNNLKLKKVMLLGTGAMALAYYKVLKSLGIEAMTVVGRSEESCRQFELSTGVKPIPRGISEWKKNNVIDVDCAIVAVSVEQLASTACELIKLGVKKILLEKPGGLNVAEITEISKMAQISDVKVCVAYNRRFYASVLKAQELIMSDGGVKSFHFEFTEKSHLMPRDIPNDDVKKNLVLTNSSHVIDLAFFLGGIPKEMSAYYGGSISWHPSAAIFSGAGRTIHEALFTYQANWNAPGRWGVELLTKNQRLILRPLEELKIQNLKSADITNIKIDDKLDLQYKPGLYLQMRSFLSDELAAFKSISEQEESAKIYAKMANYQYAAKMAT